MWNIYKQTLAISENLFQTKPAVTESESETETVTVTESETGTK